MLRALEKQLADRAVALGCSGEEAAGLSPGEA